MSCREFEPLIALYVEGDLEESDRPRVESHLNTCSDCWELAEDLKESQALFKMIRQDLPNRTMLSTVRARVLDDVAGRESGTWFERFLFGGFRQRATLAGIALLLWGGGVLWLLRSANTPIEPPPPIAASLPPALELSPQTMSPPPAAKARVSRRRPGPAPEPIPVSEEPQPQVAIKLLTDDPNVIIYWLVDEKGD